MSCNFQKQILTADFEWSHLDKNLIKKSRHSQNARYWQCDQIGLLLNYFGYIFSYKQAQIIGNFLGKIQIGHFLSQTCYSYILGNIWKNWAIFIPTSGYTGPMEQLSIWEENTFSFVKRSWKRFECRRLQAFVWLFCLCGAIKSGGGKRSEK